MTTSNASCVEISAHLCLKCYFILANNLHFQYSLNETTRSVLVITFFAIIDIKTAQLFNCYGWSHKTNNFELNLSISKKSIMVIQTKCEHNIFLFCLRPLLEKL